ncbi:MAG: histidinol-phosphate aminotransferase family protein [Gemmatimonas sp.]
MTTRAFNPLSRRQWLKSSGLVAGGAIATQSLSPALLPALEAPAAPAVVNGQTTLEGFLALEREIEAMRRADGPIRLASNENPYGMAPSAKQAINDMWKEHAWYGAAAVPELRKIYAKQMGVPEDYVLVTAGSGDVLSIVALAYAMQGGEVLTPWPTYEGLPRYAEALGARVHKVALDGDLAHDLEAMERRHVQSVDLVFVCNPNNPTGTLTDSAKLRAFVSNASRKSVVLVDEAYHDFVTDPGYTSMIDLVKAGENVIISRTASKIHGLAGLRTGFAIARPRHHRAAAALRHELPRCLRCARGRGVIARHCVSEHVPRSQQRRARHHADGGQGAGASHDVVAHELRLLRHGHAGGEGAGGDAHQGLPDWPCVPAVLHVGAYQHWHPRRDEARGGGAAGNREARNHGTVSTVATERS